MRMHVPLTLLLMTLGAPLVAACSECATSDDCDGGEVCGQGACIAPLTVLSSTTVDDIFSVELEARFLVGSATASVERSAEAPGEPCLPFAAQEFVVENTEADFAPVAVRFDGLTAVGPTFDLVFRLDGAAVTTTFSGPALDSEIGGFGVDLDVDVGTTVNVSRTPTALVTVAGDVSEATVEVVPASGLGLPLQAMTHNGSQNVAEVLLLHGPQTIDVRGTVDGSPRRCARTVSGDSGVGDDDAERASAFEFLLVADTVDGTAGGATLSMRHSIGASQAVVDGDISGELASRSIDRVSLDLIGGTVDVAVMPVVASSALNAVVRVSRAGKHVGAFGPMTLRPAAGESWVAGTVFIGDDGAATATPSSSAPQLGAPW